MNTIKNINTVSVNQKFLLDDSDNESESEFFSQDKINKLNLNGVASFLQEVQEGKISDKEVKVKKEEIVKNISRLIMQELKTYQISDIFFTDFSNYLNNIQKTQKIDDSINNSRKYVLKTILSKIDKNELLFLAHHRNIVSKYFNFQTASIKNLITNIKEIVNNKLTDSAQIKPQPKEQQNLPLSKNLVTKESELRLFINNNINKQHPNMSSKIINQKINKLTDRITQNKFFSSLTRKERRKFQAIHESRNKLNFIINHTKYKPNLGQIDEVDQS